MQENQTKLSVGHGGAEPKHVTFEAGAKKMSEKLKNGTAESFFANAADPLHAAFEAKAVWSWRYAVDGKRGTRLS